MPASKRMMSTWRRLLGKTGWLSYTVTSLVKVPQENPTKVSEIFRPSPLLPSIVFCRLSIKSSHQTESERPFLVNKNLELETRRRNGIKFSASSIIVPFASPRTASTPTFGTISRPATHSIYHCCTVTGTCSTTDRPGGAIYPIRKSTENVHYVARKVQSRYGNGRGRARAFDGKKGGNGFAR